MTDEAAEQYRAALALDPDSAAAHANLGGALARSGQLEEAERHLRASLDAKPSAPTWAGLGFVLWKQGRVDDAVGALEAAIAADATHPAAYDLLGGIRLEQGKPEAAVALFRRLAQVQPSALAHQKLAEVLFRLGRADEARREMEMAKALEQGARTIQ